MCEPLSMERDNRKSVGGMPKPIGSTHRETENYWRRRTDVTTPVGEHGMPKPPILLDGKRTNVETYAHVVRPRHQLGFGHGIKLCMKTCHQRIQRWVGVGWASCCYRPWGCSVLRDSDPGIVHRSEQRAGAPDRLDTIPRTQRRIG